MKKKKGWISEVQNLQMSWMLDVVEWVEEKHISPNFLTDPWSLSVKPWIKQNHLT